jgi:Big-like domain-containing protein
MRSQKLKVRWLRLLVSVVSTAALSATAVPPASAQIVEPPAPPSPVQVGAVTVSNLAINGNVTTVARVAPGADVTITARVSEDRQGYCPTCIAFVPVKFAAAATPAGCLLDGLTGGNNVVDGTVTLTAPDTPGVYDVVAGYALQYVCNWELAAPEATIARIVVINDPPSAASDAYATDEATPLSVGAPGVLANDADPDGDALSAVLVSGPGHGDLSLSADGSFRYSPAAGFHGSDAFSYRASDGSQYDVATAAIEVRAASQAPTPAARAAVSDVAESARCYRNARLGEPPTQGRQAMRFSYRLSAASTVRLSVLRRTGSPHWRRCPPRRGHQPGHYGPVDSRTGPGAAGVNNTTIGSVASVRKPRRSPGRVVRHQAPGRHTLTLAQVTGRPLPAGTYILQVTALDSSGAPLSRQHVKFWVFTSATAR